MGSIPPAGTILIMLFYKAFCRLLLRGARNCAQLCSRFFDRVLELLLPALDPMAVVTGCDLRARMSQECRYRL